MGGAEKENSKAVRTAQRSLSRALAAEPRVVGIGVSSGDGGEPVLLVLVSDDTAELRTLIPASVDGIPVSVLKSSRPRKL